MNTSLHLLEAAGRNQWLAIAPELMLALIALLLLALELILPKEQRAFIPGIAIVSQAAVLIGLVINFNSPYIDAGPTFNGLLHHTAGGQFLRLFFLLASILVCVLATVSLPRQRMPHVEFYHIILVVTAGMMLLAQANHFVMLFVALETVTVGLYILVSYYRDNPLTLEAGLKYLIMGALSSGILLFGITLLYGAAGASPDADGTLHTGFEYETLTRFLASHPGNFLASAGIVLVLAGVAFKVGAFPFQIWVPDVYQGAPTPVTAFLAVASKTAGFAVLIPLCLDVFAPYASLVVPVLTAMAVATILFGNLAALTQNNVKRLIGLSGVAHAGYLLIGVIAAFKEPQAVGAVYFYLFAYLLASFAVFGVMTQLGGSDDTHQDLDHYAELARERPFLGAVLAIGLGSLAGIPPLAGFMGKLLIFVSAFKAGHYGLLVVAITGVVISIYYYFGWIKAAFFPAWRLPSAEPNPGPVPRVPVHRGLGLALGLLALGSVVLGFYQGALGRWLLGL
jgi:NADH-quinone oxidoreductase subunit N